MPTHAETRRSWLDIALVILAVCLSIAVAVQALSGASREKDGMIRFAGWKNDLAFPRRVEPLSQPVGSSYTLVVWTDYQCPACRLLEAELQRLRSVLRDSVVVVYRHFPMPAHRQARTAAVFAECAWKQGRFAEMHAALFDAHLKDDEPPNPHTFVAVASLPDSSAFVSCLEDPAASSAVDSDVRRGAQIGIRATPAIQIGKRIGTGVQYADSLAARLRRVGP